MTLEDARIKLANLARDDGFEKFAREVLAGCWDHRPEIIFWTEHGLKDQTNDR